MYYTAANLQKSQADIQQMFQTSALHAEAQELRRNREEVVFTDHNATRYIFCIVKGMVKVVTYQQDKELLEDYVYQGALINWTALTGQPKAGQMAKALVDGTIILKIPVSQFRRVMNEEVQIQRSLYKCINASLHRTQRRLNELILYNSRQRLIRFFAEDVRKRGTRIGYEYLVRPMLIHQDIAQITHTSRQTATAVLNELRSLRILDFDRKKMIIRNLDGLLELADTALDTED